MAQRIRPPYATRPLSRALQRKPISPNQTRRKPRARGSPPSRFDIMPGHYVNFPPAQSLPLVAAKLSPAPGSPRLPIRPLEGAPPEERSKGGCRRPYRAPLRWAFLSPFPFSC